MSDFYKLKTAGASPLSVADAKAFMKVTSASEDTLITALINTATEFGENYTGREFRANTWILYLDEFATRIGIRKSPVATITSIKHLVSDILTAVSDATYYLKKFAICSEILLVSGSDWPTNTDDREQAIEIEFVTESYYRSAEILQALKLHVSFLYVNRGDCSCDSSSAKESGASLIYDQFRIPRI